MPRVSLSNRDLLEKDITLQEVQDVIRSLTSGKTPGDDGYPSDFYKKCNNILAPRLLTVFHCALQKGLLPSSMRKSLITGIYKKRERSPAVSYGPKFLGDVDGKILAKIYSPQ